MEALGVVLGRPLALPLLPPQPDRLKVAPVRRRMIASHKDLLSFRLRVMREPQASKLA